MATRADIRIPDYSSWRNLHSAEVEHWNDLKRISTILIPILFFLILATLSAIGYASLHGDSWTEHVSTHLDAYWFIFRLSFTFLLPLLIAIMVIVLVYCAIIEYVKILYQKPGEKKLFPLIQRRLLGKLPLPPPLNVAARYPFVVIKEPQDLKDDHWVRWLGGPATLVIYDGIAFYLERGGCFSRVVGPGTPPMPFLDRYETVKDVVDLRPQVKTGVTHPWTKDGIKVDLEIRMECQINASERARAESQNLVYPFDPVAVKEAVEYTAVKRDPKTGQLYDVKWLDGIWGQVTGYLAQHISRHSVDEIALAEIKGVGESNGNLQTFQLAKTHLDQINKNLALRKCGAHVTNTHILLKFPPEVEEQRIKYWQTEREKLIIIRDSKAKADSIRAQQEARAKAERDILAAITERLKRINPDNLTEPLILSLTGILDSSLDDPLIRPLIAKHSLALLEKLRDILNQPF